jgi:hypothetical protein
VLIWLSVCPPAAVPRSKRRRGADEARFLCVAVFEGTTDLPQFHDKANTTGGRRARSLKPARGSSLLATWCKSDVASSLPGKGSRQDKVLASRQGPGLSTRSWPLDKVLASRQGPGLSTRSWSLDKVLVSRQGPGLSPRSWPLDKVLASRPPRGSSLPCVLSHCTCRGTSGRWGRS